MEFKNNLKNVLWMDELTKEKAFEKVGFRNPVKFAAKFGLKIFVTTKFSCVR